MAEGQHTFSESWYRIANQRVALRSHVLVRRQFFRGERFYVVHDPFNNQFFRLLPAAYQFIARLRPDRTVESVWLECMETDPEDAPGQEEVIRLLAQLHASSLLHSSLPPDSGIVSERYRQRRQRETKATLLNIMYSRFPLLDPDAFLRAASPLLRLIISPLGALVWLAVVGAAVKVVLDHAVEIADQSQAILAPGNLVLLYCGFVVVKALHEFGHACACRRFGGEVHVMGIMLMIFTPVPYVDTTSSWGFRSRWQRAFVGAAGMIAELFVAALAVFVWAKTGPGTINSLAYNIMFTASVSTVLFNINPLLRFDGYYILSDLLDIPNLQTRSNQQLTHLAERYLFGRKQSRSPAWTNSEAFGLSFYGIASTVYRLFVFGAILLFISGRFLILGILMALACAIVWIVMPLGRLVDYLATSPRLARHRPRAVAVCAGSLLVLLSALAIVPAPNSFRAPGVLEAVQHRIVSAVAPGHLDALLLDSGAHVREGQPLVKLSNPELELDIAGVRAELKQAHAERLLAMQEATADLKPIDSRIEAIEKRRRRLEQDEATLVVRAQHEGIWVAPDLKDQLGAWLVRGTELGQVVNPKTFYFSVIVPQRDASRLFAGEIRSEEVRLFGQGHITLPVVAHRIIPAEQQTLPSAALGWLSGGEVALASDDSTGVAAREPFFEVRATVAAASDVALLHGRAGRIRFVLSPEPLLHQWSRRFRQLLQKHYGL